MALSTWRVEASAGNDGRKTGTMLIKDSTLIGQELVTEGIITQEQLEAGLRAQEKNGDLLCENLVRLGFASKSRVFGLLARRLNIPYVDLKERVIDTAVIRKVPAKFVSHYKIVPLEMHDHALTVAIADPFDVRMLDDIGLLLGLRLNVVLSGAEDIEDAIRKYYGIGAETLEKMISDGSDLSSRNGDSEKIEDLETLAEDASIIKFVNQILAEAIKDRATDIHLEPFYQELRARFRIDGMLYNIPIPENIRLFHLAIVSRIKIMANLNIAERRLPQDGRLKIKVNGSELDLRVSTLPTVFGEAVHLRILSSKQFLELEKLGFSDQDLKTLERMIRKSHGVIFVTGPTGSGKSTTLYACLARINSEEIKIITIEDPVEYQLRGVNQVQVQSKINFDFATGLRHLLRHDPDVMMIGEVRDSETAEIAIRAALTGHLVFSTLHTNDAAGAVTRLIDMNIEPFLVSSSMECMIAQRLVRLICPHCKEAISPNAETVQQISREIGRTPKDVVIYEGRGCEECKMTGYRGRTAIYEILLMTQPIREMVLNRATSQQIRQKAIAGGMRTLRQDGLEKVLSGMTTYSEVMRVTQQEEMPED